jgi:hypothetical protein
MENKKQSAVEWIVEQVNSDCLNSTFIRPNIINAALAMEKEQIIDAYLQKRGKGGISEALKFWDEAEQYYNETYGK